MNTTAKRSFNVSLLFLMGAALFLGACGPELDDPSFLAQAASMEASTDANAMQAQNAMPQDENKDVQPMMGNQGEVQAAVAAPVVAQLPGVATSLPPRVIVDPTIVTNTAEQRLAAREILVEQPVIRRMPSVNIHDINTNLHTERKFHTTVYNQPSFGGVVRTIPTATESVTVLPTTEVTLPAIMGPGAIAPVVAPGAAALQAPAAPLDAGAIPVASIAAATVATLAPVGYGAGVWGPTIPYNWGWNPTWGVVPGSLGGRPGCARYLSGGFFRNCR